MSARVEVKLSISPELWMEESLKSEKYKNEFE
jgi:hypothetical protein